jgi:hypothetical protein
MAGWRGGFIPVLLGPHGRAEDAINDRQRHVLRSKKAVWNTYVASIKSSDTNNTIGRDTKISEPVGVGRLSARNREVPQLRFVNGKCLCTSSKFKFGSISS